MTRNWPLGELVYCPADYGVGLARRLGHWSARQRRSADYRDADGLPFVPAKTLRGIWRDACERVAYGLDSDDW